MKYFHRTGHSPPADPRRAIVISQSMCTRVLVKVPYSKLVQENRCGYTCTRLIDHQ